MTVPAEVNDADVNRDNEMVPDPSAVLEKADPKVLRHVVDRLRSAGNTAFRERQYGGGCLSNDY